MRAWKHAIRRRTDFHVDCRIRRWDGVYRWHAFSALPVCDEFGVVVKWIGTAVDVDDEKAMQADLEFARAQGRRDAGTAGDPAVQRSGRIRLRRPRISPSAGE